MSYQPDHLAGWRPGDLADIQGIGRVQVVRIVDGSLIEVRTASGGMCKVGYRALSPIRIGERKLA